MKGPLRSKMMAVVALLEKHSGIECVMPAVASLLNQYKAKIEGHQFKMGSPPKNMIYANNHMNFGELNVIGFDLDYTLVNYTVELQDLIYRQARDVLVNAYGYPQDLSNFEFDPKFAIRGLTVDARHGTISKLSSLQRLALNRTYRGKQQLTAEEMRETYGDDRHIPFGDMYQMKPLNDLFTVSEACLIADTMELFMSVQRRTGEKFDLLSIVTDVQNAISDVHINGSMQNAVLADPEQYIKDSPNLASMLQHVSQSGKKAFLCTNSGYKYSSKALNHVLGLKPSSTEWKDFFDVVICSAKKPDFYKSRTPFRQFNVLRNSPTASPVGSLDKGQVYVQGSAAALLRATGWKGKQILYIGDNLRSDLVEARRWHGWHTGCIINELETEICTQQTPEFRELHFLRATLRTLMYDLQGVMQAPHVDAVSGDGEFSLHAHVEPNVEASTSSYPLGKPFGTIDEALLSAVEQELQTINSQLSQLFNPHFGSVFRTDGHPSLFAFAMARYVDLYMADVTNLMHYNPAHRFYPYHAMHMAHDPASASSTAQVYSPVVPIL
jgi:HAD superfamily 5'-nucleotidase-like hydrolase